MKRRLGLIGILLAIALVAAVFTMYADSLGKEQQFTFAVFGDNRPGMPTAAPTSAFRTVLKTMASFDPEFALNTGDCIYGSSNLTRLQAQYKDYDDTVKSLLDKKVYLAIGNHEMHAGKAGQAFFKKELGEIYYSFDRGDAHFIVLDSDVAGQASRIMGDQIEWLKQDLYKSRAARFRFVFLHQPLYPVDGHRGSSMDRYVKDRDSLHSLFVRSRITAVFAGHEHLFNVQKRNGVLYVITGGGGAATYPSIEGEGDFYHFLLVTVAGDKLDMKLVKPAGGGRPQEVLPLMDLLKQ